MRGICKTGKELCLESAVMYFKPPSFVPELPFTPPDTLPVHEFLFGEGDQYGRYPIAKSKPPFTCGITGKSYSAIEVGKRIELLSRALASRLGWQVNSGHELDKVTCVYSVNTVNLLLIHAHPRKCHHNTFSRLIH